MPDSWETDNGLNPNDASDGRTYADNGYTNLENYLNSLVDHITSEQYAGGEQQGDIIVKENGGASDEEGKQVEGNGAICWHFGNGGEGQTADYAESIAPLLGSDQVNLGSHLTYQGKRTLNGTAFTLVQPTVSNEPTTLPHKLTSKVGFQRVRFYVTGTNLFVISDYPGFDPEVSSYARNSSYSGLTPGIDFSSYPKSRAFTFGVNVTL